MRHLALLLLLLLLTGCTGTPSAADYARADADAAAIRRQAALSEALAPVDTALAVIWRIIAVAFALGTLGAMGRYAYLALVRYERERLPNADGVLPVPAAHLDTIAPAALAATHAARVVQASHPPAPHTVHIRVQGGAPSATGGAPVAHQVQADAPGLPGVTDAATLGYRAHRAAILLALGTGGTPVTVPLSSLCHVALVGATGGGKSNALRLLLPQLLAVGARVSLCDPHYTALDADNGDDWRPIAARLAGAPAVAARDIDAEIDRLCTELHQRLAIRRDGGTVGAPWFLAVDELPVIADTVPDAMPRLTSLLREGRKVGLYVLGASQSMLVKALGGDSSARDAYRTCIYSGGDTRSASALLDIPQRDIPEGALGPGVAMVRAAGVAAQVVRIPYASNAYLHQVLPLPNGSGSGSGSGSGAVAAGSATGSGGAGAPSAPGATASGASGLSDADTELLRQFLAGSSVGKLAAELNGGTPGGRGYQVQAHRVNDVLRRALGAPGESTE